MTPALEAALAAIDAAIPAGDADSAHQLVAAKCRGLMVGYDAKWSGSEYRPVLDDAGRPILEQTIHLPIINPETGRKSRTWTQAGKFDGIIEGFGRRLLLEHKTVSSSEDIADPNSTYWRRLAIDSQVSAYLLHSWQQGEKLDGALYDVIRKPAIRPKALARKDVAEITTTGRYCGWEVPDEVYQRIVRGQAEECAVLYALRLAAIVCEEPDRYFQRRHIPRLDHDVMAYAVELWQIGQEILSARNRGHNYRNSAACMEFNRPCAYLGVCSGHDEIDSDRWQRMAQVHAELELPPEAGDGRAVLTHSRIKAFQSCRQRHQFRYELGVVRRDEEESEALFLGSVLHGALEQWWALQNTQPRDHAQGEDDAAYCPASAVGQPAALTAP